jgi:hypothetical protein
VSTTPVADTQPTPLSNSPSLSETSSSEIIPPVSTEERGHQFGALFDVGAPDGIGVSAVYSPFYFVRVHGGLSTIYYTSAIRFGVTLMPFQFWANPTFSADYGHYFQANLSSLVGNGADPFARSLLKAVGGDYVNLHLGLEFGRPQKFQFYIRGGLSFASASPDNFSDALKQSQNNNNLEAANPTVHITIPSAKIGAVWFFL